MPPCPVSVTRSILMLVGDQNGQVVAVDAFETQTIPHTQMGIRQGQPCHAMHIMYLCMCS